MLFSEFERYGYELGLYVSRDIGNLHARVHMETHRTKGRHMRGVDNLRGATAGNAYHIANHDHNALNHEVLIMGTELLFEDVGIHSGGAQ